jgi:V8-like Glu-specific endopeptidase
MKFFKYSLLLSTSLLLNSQNSWAMDSAELKDLGGLSHKTKLYKVSVTTEGLTTRFTQSSDGTGISTTSHEERALSKFLNIKGAHKKHKKRCEVIGETDAWPENDTQPESVLTNIDRRKRKNNTTDLPHRFHGQMIMAFPNGKRYTGSGTMVSPHHVLTAGHNLHSEKDGGWATSVSFIPGRNEDQQPYGKAKGEILLSPQEWTIDRKRAHDYGMVVLDQDIGKKTGWAGLFVSDDEELENKNIYVSGYPGDKGATQLWSMKGKPTRLDSNRISYEIDTYPGQSGSGVFMKDKNGHYVLDKNGYYVLGVHTYGGEHENSATRITSEKFDKLISWMQNPYMSPPCRGMVCISSQSKWDAALHGPGESPYKKNVLSTKEKERLKKGRDNQRANLIAQKKKLENQTDCKPSSKGLSKNQNNQITKMSGKGIIVSDRLNETGNLDLVSTQIVYGNEALNDINIFFDNVHNNPGTDETIKKQIEILQRAHNRLNDPKKLEKSVSGSFFSPAEATLSHFNRTRYEGFTKDTLRSEQINKSKKQGVPVHHRSTPTANLVRSEKVLEKQDTLLLKAFDIEMELRIKELGKKKIDKKNKTS